MATRMESMHATVTLMTKLCVSVCAELVTEPDMTVFKLFRQGGHRGFRGPHIQISNFLVLLMASPNDGKF